MVRASSSAREQGWDSKRGGRADISCRAIAPRRPLDAQVQHSRGGKGEQEQGDGHGLEHHGGGLLRPSIEGHSMRLLGRESDAASVNRGSGVRGLLSPPGFVQSHPANRRHPHRCSFELPDAVCQLGADTAPGHASWRPHLQGAGRGWFALTFWQIPFFDVGAQRVLPRVWASLWPGPPRGRQVTLMRWRRSAAAGGGAPDPLSTSPKLAGNRYVNLQEVNA